MGQAPMVVITDWGKILRGFQRQTEKLVVANQPEIVAVDKQSKTAIVIDVSYVAYKNMTECSDSPLQSLKYSHNIWGLYFTVL